MNKNKTICTTKCFIPKGELLNKYNHIKWMSVEKECNFIEHNCNNNVGKE